MALVKSRAVHKLLSHCMQIPSTPKIGEAGSESRLATRKLRAPAGRGSGYAS